MILNYLSEKQANEVLKADVSSYEKLIVIMTLIEKKNPEARFSSQDIASFLGKTPKGITTMFKSIKSKYPSFPIQMLIIKQDDKKIDCNIVDKLHSQLFEMEESN